MSINSVKNDTIAQDSVTSAQKPIPPTISGYAVSGKDDLALDPAGGQTVLLNGTGFQRGATITLDGSAISVVTYVSSNQLSFTSPAKSSGSYAIYVVNADLGTAIYIPGLLYSPLPTWTTASGTLGSYYETQTINNTVVATGDAPITYSLFSGTLPTGASLSSSGVITGTAPADTGSTTYTFTIQASDAQLQDSTRSFSLTINTDVITWSTPANASVTTSYEYTAISNVALSATSAANSGITYSANSLPTGLSLSANVISGTANTVGNTAVLLTATGNTTTRNATRTVFFNVQQDVVTWSNPSSNTSISLDGSAYSNVLSANSAAGFSVSYTANTLPTGLSLSSATISGTPTVEGTTTTLLTATAATTNRSAQRTITWTVNFSDIYWKYIPLLLSADSTTQTQSFVADNSINNAQLTVFGDTRAQNLNPYQVGYYSASFNGTTDYVLFPSDITVSGAFTIEFWMNSPNANAASTNYYIYTQNSTATNRCFLAVLNNTTYNSFRVATNFGSSSYSTFNFPSLFPNNTWFHVAIVRDSSNNLTAFVNGVRSSTGTASNSDSGIMNVIGRVAPSGFYNGYISNFRIVVGSAVYDPTQSTITVPSSPLTAIANTQALVLQSNRFNDNSVNNYALTLTGTPSISTAHPFTTQYQVTPYYSSYFNGSTDYIQTTINPSTFSSSWTIECWAYQGAQTNDPAVILGTTSYGFLLYFTSSLYVSCEISSDGSTAAVNAYGNITNNKWYHIAIVKNGSGSNNVTIYVNGVSAGQGTLSNPIVNAGNLRIGYGYNTWYWNGYISNLRIVNGTAVYTTNFTPSTTPLTAITNTALLTCQSSTIIDNSGNSSSLTVNGNTQQYAISPFIPSYSSTQITTYGSGYFDGTGDYLQIGLNPGLDLTTGNFTIEAWVYQTASKTYTSIISSGNAAWGTGAVKFNIQTLSPSLSVNSNATTFQGPAIINNTWNHIAVTRLGTKLKIFTNGVAGTTYTMSDAINLNYNSNTKIGGGDWDGANSYMTGYISDLRVVKDTALYTSNFVPQFTRPLTNITNTQLLTLQSNGNHNNNMFSDNSGFNNIITRAGNTNVGTFSPYGDNWSVYLNGTTDYFTISNNAAFDFGTSDVTIECWVYPLTFSPGGGGTSDYNYIISAYPASGSITAWYFGYGQVGNVGMGSWVSGTNQSIGTDSNVLTVGQWAHVAFTRTSGTNRIFVNGVSKTITGTFTQAINTGGNPIHIGAMLYTTYYNYPKAYISNLRIVKGTSLYTSDFTVSTGSLSAVGNTSLLTFQSPRFIDNSPNNFTLTPTGTPSVQKFSPFSTITVPKYYSTYFNGSTDYLTIPSSTAMQGVASGNMTIEFWVNLRASISASYLNVMQKGRTANSDFEWGLYLTGSTGSGSNMQISWQPNTGSGTANNTYNSSLFSMVTNTWYHVAICVSGTTVYFFLNGAAVGTASVVLQSFTASSATGIGNNYSGTNAFAACYLSNIRIVKGTSLYTSAFTPSTTPLTAITNTILLTCQDRIFVDNSTNNLTISAATATVKPLLVSPFTPTASGAVSYSPTTLGGSMYFDGTGDYLSVPDNGTMFDVLAVDFTIECWFYPTTTCNNSLFAKRATTATYGGIQVSFANSLAPNLIFTIDGTTWGVNTTSSVSCQANAWNHIALTRNGTTFRLFVNGVQGIAVTSNGTIPDNSAAFTIGSNSADGTANITSGYISDFRMTKGISIYNSNFYPGSTPLTATQTIGTSTYNSVLLLNGTSGGIIDATRTVNFETVGNTGIVQNSPYSGNAYSVLFNGSPDFIQFPNFISAGNAFTFEFWINSPNADAASGGYCIFSTNPYNQPNRCELFILSSEIRFSVNNSSSVYDSFTIPTLQNNKWHHIAVVRDSSNRLTIFVNGTRSSTGVITNSLSPGSYNEIGLNFTTYYKGYISNFRHVTSAVYDPTQTTITVPTAPLTAIANTAALILQSNTLKDNSANNYSLTITGAPKVATQNPFQVNTGQSYYFDGTGDYFYTQPNPVYAFGTGDFTVEAWMCYTGTLSGNLVPICQSDAVGSSTNDKWWFGFNNNTLYFNTHSSGGFSVTISFIPVVGVWYHLAATRASGTIRLFVNGVSGNTAVSGSTTNSLNQNGIVIGGMSTPYYMTGYITDLRITKGYARYTTTFTPPTQPYKTK